MSLGDRDPTTELRALAHPVRLRILSLLTGAAMTAAEIARELELTHANASYHLRHLLAGGIIQVDGEERIRGGKAKRYRYDVAADLDRPPRPEGAAAPPPEHYRLVYAAMAAELRRRAELWRRGPHNYLADAELWVPAEAWKELHERFAAAADDLHRVAVAPRTPGALRVSATVALFEMGDR
jgi:DNA-binding transcriptional ArsR family regulator